MVSVIIYIYELAYYQSLATPNSIDSFFMFVTLVLYTLLVLHQHRVLQTHYMKEKDILPSFPILLFRYRRNYLVNELISNECFSYHPDSLIHPFFRHNSAPVSFSVVILSICRNMLNYAKNMPTIIVKKRHPKVPIS